MTPNYKIIKKVFTLADIGQPFKVREGQVISAVNTVFSETTVSVWLLVELY